MILLFDPMQEDSPIYFLTNNPVKQYEWGSSSNRCQVATLSKASNYSHYA